MSDSVDLRPTLVAKSDQLNSDDLLGRSLTIKITKVSLTGEAEQPLAIHYEGDNGKPYKPGKSMRRVLSQVWTPEGSTYVGRRLTLYRDEKVQFGGMAVGGIRISHMSDIDGDITMALTATRGNKRPFTVRPLAAEPGPAKPKQTPKEWADGQGALLKSIVADNDVDAFEVWLAKAGPALEKLKASDPTTAEALHAIVAEARRDLGADAP